jgi:hypothetical protein
MQSEPALLGMSEPFHVDERLRAAEHGAKGKGQYLDQSVTMDTTDTGGGQVREMLPKTSQKEGHTARS